MNIEANTKTTTKYIVYWEGDSLEPDFGVYYTLATARTKASELASNHPGKEFHIAAHMATFRAETVVKEV